MPSLTGMEKQAIEDARASLFRAITDMGIADRFNDLSKEQVDYLIYYVWLGVRTSMQQQSNAGEMPF